MKKLMTSLVVLGAMTYAGVAAEAATPQRKAETVTFEQKVVQNDVNMQAVKDRITVDLKQALNARGYDAGPANATYDAKTATAVRAFQRDNGMPETGEATPDMMAQLGVDLTVPHTATIVEREVRQFPLANKGSENANVYDDPNADRTGTPRFTQRYDRLSDRGDTRTETEVRYVRPALNR